MRELGISIIARKCNYHNVQKSPHTFSCLYWENTNPSAFGRIESARHETTPWSFNSQFTFPGGESIWKFVEKQRECDRQACPHEMRLGDFKDATTWPPNLRFAFVISAPREKWRPCFSVDATRKAWWRVRKINGRIFIVRDEQMSVKPRKLNECLSGGWQPNIITLFPLFYFSVLIQTKPARK